MTQKDYIILAEEFRAALQVSAPEGQAATNATLRAIEGIATVCQRDNARFNRQKFLKACSVNK